MRTSKSGVLVLAAVFSVGALSGCATKKDTGTLVGATAGGLIGHVAAGKNHVAAAVFGAVLGGAVGRSIGEHMDESDEGMVIITMNNPKTTPTKWKNADTQAEHKLTPGPTSKWKGLDCRNAQHEIKLVGKQKIETQYVSCQQQDGKWVRVVPESESVKKTAQNSTSQQSKKK